MAGEDFMGLLGGELRRIDQPADEGRTHRNPRQETLIRCNRIMVYRSSERMIGRKPDVLLAASLSAAKVESTSRAVASDFRSILGVGSGQPFQHLDRGISCRLALV